MINTRAPDGANNIDASKFLYRRYLQTNINNNLVFCEIEIFIISLFETRSRFVSSTSRASRQDREFVLSNLEYREGYEIYIYKYI